VSLIPGSKLQIIPGASHLANLDKPDEFNAAIDGFLATLESS
jgi:pimeloyl-ACP methyl ester carboxylesterase